MGYYAVKSFSAFCRGKTSKNNADFHCLNCLNSFRTENKFKIHKNICKNHDCCYIEWLEKVKTLKYNHKEKSVKVPFIIHADMESLL